MKVIICAFAILFFCASFSSANDKKAWKQEDCKKISDASGHFLVLSGYLLEESGKKKEEGDLKEMEKSFMGAVHFSEMAANYAKTYQVFCQSKKEKNHDD
ncbi:MAG: hypothetical protein QGH50_13625 [SAR324 cluster bacterium]|nr:hypothetical protein [SAR324 cluster bacterium]